MPHVQDTVVGRLNWGCRKEIKTELCESANQPNINQGLTRGSRFVSVNSAMGLFLAIPLELKSTEVGALLQLGAPCNVVVRLFEFIAREFIIMVCGHVEMADRDYVIFAVG